LERILYRHNHQLRYHLGVNEWNNKLGKISTVGGSDDEKTIFYTALYHSLVAPNLFSDTDNRFRAHDNKIYKNDSFTMHTVFSLWDTFRTLHPLFTIIEQDRSNHFINSMLNMYKHDNLLPVWAKKHYSLLQLTKSIESVITKTYRRSYWVKAEIAKLNYYPKSGHCYPDLVEKEKGTVLAQMRATIWAGHFNDINNKFIKVTKEPLSDGITVLIRANVVYHPVYGLSLHVIDIEPSFTLGEMAKEKIKSIERLKKDGFFNRNKYLAPALLLQRIAIISVETSKGYHDFIKIIEGNEWGYSFFHMLFPALLQGEGAIKSITDQLSRIKKVQSHFDVVVIVRGGGGDVGLSSYDNYELAKKVALFPLPVITGIGHATNETVVELVAFSNKITPTDVGYFLIQKFHNFSVRIQEAHNLLKEKSRQISVNEDLKIKSISSALKSNIISCIYNERTNLSSIAIDFKHSTSHILNNTKFGLERTISTFGNAVNQLYNKKDTDLMSYQKQLSTAIDNFFQLKKSHLSFLLNQVRLFDPVNLFKRGYSLTSINGSIITDTSKIRVNDIIETKTYKGSIKSKVIFVEKPKEH